jgi:hypothetical protein
MEQHFANIKNCLAGITKDKSLLLRIIKCRQKNIKILDSIDAAKRYIDMNPWTKDEDLYEMCCILRSNKIATSVLYETLAIKKVCVGEEKFLLVPNTDNTIASIAKKRLSFASLFLQHLRHKPGLRVCYFGMHHIFYGRVKYNIRLMWATCGNCEELICTKPDGESFMIMSCITQANSSDEYEKVEQWISQIVAVFLTNDKETEMKRCAVYDKEEYNFADDLLHVQKHLLPFVFNTAIGELNPFTVEMKNILNDFFQKHKNDVEEFVVNVYLAFNNNFLQNVICEFIKKMEKIVATNGFLI